MSLCYDFQKWTILSLGLTAATLIIGLVLMQVGHGQINNNTTSKNETEKPMEVNWTMVSSLAAVVGIIVSALVSAFTFRKTYSRMKTSEQIRMAHDIENNLTLALNSVKEAMSIQTENPDSEAEKKETIRFRWMQYLNVWEWYSFLVNKNQINIKEIIDHFKRSMLTDSHLLFTIYPEFKTINRFNEFIALCEKLESEK